MGDKWDKGDPYERFMGRWSQLMAPVFLQWLNPAVRQSWLDLGCGTGALSEAIEKLYDPLSLFCVEPSSVFLQKTRQRVKMQAEFLVGNSSKIPLTDKLVDVVVSGLALNFFPDLEKAFFEMKRVLKPGGMIAAYVWDYSGGMEFLRIFWDVAGGLDEKARMLDERIRFPICSPVNLESLFRKSGLDEIETDYLEIETVFQDFSDYWDPFLGGQGPAPSYLLALPPGKLALIKAGIKEKLRLEADGSIKLKAGAIAVRGKYS